MLKVNSKIILSAKNNRHLHILICGASGYLGTALISHVQKTMPGRNKITIVGRKNSLKHFKGDFLSWNDLASNGLPSGVGAVVNFAGQNVLDPLHRWTRKFEETCRTSRQESARILSECISNSAVPPAVFVQVSGVGYYPSFKTLNYENVGTEESPSGKGYWAEFTKSWESKAKLSDDSPCRLILLRTSPVLGPDGGALAPMYPIFKMGLGGMMGSGEQPFPWIHIRDYTRLITHLIETPENISGPVIAASPNICTNRDFSRNLAHVLNRPFFMHVPSMAVELMFGKTRAQMLLEGSNVYPRAAIKSGFKFEFSNIHDALLDIYK